MNSNELLEKFKNEIESAPWPPLRSHYDRGAIYIVDKDLELSEVALALSEDRVTQVKQWLDEGVMYPPLEKEVELWDKNNDIQFNFLIIQPYVLIQR